MEYTSSIVLGRYPTLARYLERLPGGLSAHPGCSVKGSVVRMYLDPHPLDVDDPEIPAPVRALAANPPAAGAWVNEVAFCAATAVIRDVHFHRDAEYCAWVKKASGALYRTPLYRLLMLVASPSRALDGAEKRWLQFRRGTSISIRQDGTTADVRMEFPAHLFDGLLVAQFAAAFEAAAEAAGALNCRSASLEVGRDRALVRMTWEE